MRCLENDVNPRNTGPERSDRSGAINASCDTGARPVHLAAVLIQVPGYIDDHDSMLALHQQSSGKDAGALVVEKILIPLTLDEFGQQYCYRAAGICVLGLQNMVENRLYYKTKR